MYTDQGRIEAYLNRELSESEIVLCDDVISSISNLIDLYCGRSWLPVDETIDSEAETSTRLFDGTGSRELYIDDFVSIEEINILDSSGGVINTLNQNIDWVLYPLNKTPKQSIRLNTAIFLRGAGNIQVEAVWGSGEVPQPIIKACTIMVANYFTKASKSGLKKESIEGYSYEMRDLEAEDQDTLSLLGFYKKYTL